MKGLNKKWSKRTTDVLAD